MGEPLVVSKIWGRYAERKFSVEYLVFYDFLSSDPPFGRHVGLCVISGLFFHFSSANIGVFCSFWWKFCFKSKFTFLKSSHDTKFHQNRATGLDFLLHKPDASYAIFLIFKCQYRGVLFILMTTLLKTEIYIEHKLSPHKVSSKSGHRFRIFTSYGRCFMTIFQVPISGWPRLSIKIFT